MTERECIIKLKKEVSDEDFLQEKADEFVANALWCGKVGCKGLIAFTPAGLVERGYCNVGKREFSDANVHTFDDLSEDLALEEQSSTSFSFSDIRDDLIGGVSNGIYNDPRVGRRV